MIRIDEIYSNTFRPWLQANRPGARVLYHDPFGRSDPDSLCNFSQGTKETSYIYFFDQEPIHLDLHMATFDDVERRNLDISWPRRTSGAIVTSEKDSEFVEFLCDRYQWDQYYYFFHGWAALDWYRGYNRTFLIPKPQDRRILHSFISPNRVIGGQRAHRIMLMYHLFKHKIKNALISFPRICPTEHKDVTDLSKIFGPEVQEVFKQAPLPLSFPGETDHPMHSCWLSLFKENASCLAHVVSETVFTGQRYHLTEKTFKPICLQLPFILVSTAYSLEYLKSYGFKTFASVWDESYDLEPNDDVRLVKIAALLKDLDDQSPRELQQIYHATLPVLEHNFHHFYGGGFENVLWQELTHMMTAIGKA